MASGLKSYKPSVTPQLSSPKPSPTAVLKAKLRKSLQDSRFNCPINWPSVLISAAEESVVRLTIPETLITEAEIRVFLYNDKEGVVRMRKGHRASQEFLVVCKANRERVRNMNPRGLRFPKFITFQGCTPEFTINDKKQVLEYLTKQTVRLQRFIIPENFIVKKKLVHWRRTKVMRIYALTPKRQRVMRTVVEKLGLFPTQMEANSPALDQQYVMSSRLLENSELTKEQRLSDEEMRLLGVARQVVEKYAVLYDEQLEELVLSLVSATSGKSYLLNVSKVRTSRKQAIICPLSPTFSRRSSILLKGIEERLQSSLSFPPMCQLPKVSSFVTLPPIAPLRKRCESELSSPADDPVTTEIAKAASNIDLLRKKAQAFKEASESRLRWRFFGHSPDFLSACWVETMHSATRNPYLEKYFQGKPCQRERMEKSMTSVFAHGRYPNAIREIHRKLDISDREFEQLLDEFGKSLRTHGAKQSDSEEAMKFLEGFRDCVVTRRRASILEGSALAQLQALHQ